LVASPEGILDKTVQNAIHLFPPEERAEYRNFHLNECNRFDAHGQVQGSGQHRKVENLKHSGRKKYKETSNKYQPG
jgi:hypothetical protein